MPLPSFIESPSFPTYVSEGSSGGPGFKTDIFTGQSGAEQRNSLWQNARCSYDISHGIRNKTDMDTVLAFFYNVRGRAVGFRFKDWSDYIVENQTIGNGDGSTTDFQLIKTYTTGAYTYTRDIKKPVSGTLTSLTVGGVPKSEGADFTIDYTTGVVSFGAAPASGAIVVDYIEFDVPCRFDTDEMPITLEAFELETWDGITIVELPT